MAFVTVTQDPIPMTVTDALRAPALTVMTAERSPGTFGEKSITAAHSSPAAMVPKQPLVTTGNSSVLEFVKTSVSVALPPVLRTVQVTSGGARVGSTVSNCRVGAEPTRMGGPD